jgi:hypothetical protein
MLLYNKPVVGIDLDDPFYVQKTNRQLMRSVSPNAKFGGDDAPEPQSRFSREEQSFRNEFSNFLSDSIGKSATPYDGELYAELDPQAFENLFSQARSFEGVNEQGLGALSQQLSGDALFEYDPQQTTDFWRENVANPMMNVWNNTVGSEMRESFGGGDLFNTRASQAVGRAGSEFFGSSVSPTLFNAQMQGQQWGINSAENAAGRQANALQFQGAYQSAAMQNTMTPFLLQQADQQGANTAAFGEFQRMAQENSPWTQMALAGFTGMQPSQDTVMGSSSGGLMGGLMGGIGGGMAGAALAGTEAGAFLGPWGMIGGAALGAGIGFMS